MTILGTVIPLTGLYCREGEMSKKALKKQQKEAEKAARKAEKQKENKENVGFQNFRHFYSYDLMDSPVLHHFQKYLSRRVIMLGFVCNKMLP